MADENIQGIKISELDLVSSYVNLYTIGTDGYLRSVKVPLDILGKIGNPADLQTVDKSSLVAAINEAAATGGGGGGTNLTGFVVEDSIADLPVPGQPTLGYLVGENLYLYVGSGGDTKGGAYQDCGKFRGPQGPQGIQGIQGPQGNIGPAGQDGEPPFTDVEVAVTDNTSGTPSADAVIEDDTLQITFHHIKGDDAVLPDNLVYLGPDDAPVVVPEPQYEETANRATSWGSTPSDLKYPSEKLVKDSLDGKQVILVSGQNIKTINNQSLLGSGDITIQGGGGSDPDAVKFTAQSLTSEQQAQARTNIGAASQAVIPSAASPSNQLADKTFVNSSISTATATYRGSYNLVSDLSLTTSATQAQIATALGTAVSTADNNDYTFVQIPTADLTPTEIARVERYKYNGSTWAFEYALNNSGFTAAQWAALNSGITSGLVGKLSDLPTNLELTNLLAGKQDSMVVLTYGTSTWNDFITAYNKNAVVYCYVANGNTGRLAFMAYKNGDSNVEFQYYRSVSSHSATQQGDQVFIYNLTSGSVWTTTTREAMIWTQAGNGLQRSVSGNNMTYSVKTPSNSGLTVNSNGVAVTKPVPSTASTDNGKVLGVTDTNGTLGWVAQPTVPTISTDVSADANDDTKTSSPKSVKTYVDSVVGDIETLLAAI